MFPECLSSLQIYSGCFDFLQISVECFSFLQLFPSYKLCQLAKCSIDQIIQTLRLMLNALAMILKLVHLIVLLLISLPVLDLLYHLCSLFFQHNLQGHNLTQYLENL